MLKRFTTTALLALFIPLTVVACGGCVTSPPAEVAVAPTVDEVAEARNRAVKAATTITAGLTIATQALEVADELERSNLLRPQVLREMAEQSEKLSKAAKVTLSALEKVSGGETIDLRKTLQVVLGEFETMLKLFDSTSNVTLKNLAAAARAVLAIITVAGV